MLDRPTLWGSPFVEILAKKRGETVMKNNKIFILVAIIVSLATVAAWALQLFDALPDESDDYAD